MNVAGKGGRVKSAERALALPSTHRRDFKPFGRNAKVLAMQRTVGNRVTGQLLQPDTANTSPDRGKTPAIVQEALRGSRGQPLDHATRAFMEDRFGVDFSYVRVHTDKQAKDSARALNASAYAVGQDVAFASGQYAPETARGKRLLAHELAHILQQRRSRTTLPCINATGDVFERHAHALSSAIVDGTSLNGAGSEFRNKALVHQPAGVPPLLQRKTHAESQQVSAPATELGTALEEQEETTAEKTAKAMSQEIGSGQEVKTGLNQLRSVTVGRVLAALSEAGGRDIAGGVGIAQVPSADATLFDVARQIWYVANRLYVLNRQGLVESERPHYDLKGVSLLPGTYFMGQFSERSRAKAQANVLLIRLGGGTDVQFVPAGFHHKAGIFMRSSTQDKDPLQGEAKDILRSVSKEQRERGAPGGNAGIGIIVSSQFAHRQRALSGKDYSTSKVAKAVLRIPHHLAWIAQTELNTYRDSFRDRPLESVLDQVKQIASSKLQSTISDLVPVVGEVYEMIRKLRQVAWLAETASIAAYAKNEGEIDIAAQIFARALVQQAIGELISHATGALEKGIHAGISAVKQKVPVPRKTTPAHKELTTDAPQKKAAKAPPGEDVSKTEEAPRGIGKQGPIPPPGGEAGLTQEAKRPTRKTATEPESTLQGVSPKKGTSGPTGTTSEQVSAKHEEQHIKDIAQSPKHRVDVSEETSQDVERSFHESDVDVSPGASKQSRQKPESKAKGAQVNLTHEEIAASNRVLGKKLEDNDVLRKHWENVANANEKAQLTKANSRRLFNNQRRRFWRAVRNDPSARKLFEDAGFDFPKNSTSAPVRRGVPGRFGRISLDHIKRRAAEETSALDARNLRFVVHGDNTMLEALQQAIPSLRQGSEDK